MSNILKLTKVYFKSFIGSLIKNKNNPNFYVGLLLCGFISIIMTFTFSVNAISSTAIFLEQAKEFPGAEQMAMYTNCTLAILMLLFLTIMRSVMPSKNRDSDLLLSFPLKKMEITISKSLYNYIVDLVLFLSILLPSFIVYVIMVSSANVFIVIRGFFLILLLPLVSNALATFIGLMTNKLILKFKYYSIVQTAIIIILTAGYLIANYSIQGYLTNGLGGSTVEEIRNKFFVVKVMLEFILDGKILWMLVFTFIIVGVYAASLIFLNLRLGKLEKKYVNKTKKLIFKKNNIMKTLVKKELKQYFNTPIYLLNTILPGVVYFGLCVAICIIGEDKALSFLVALPEVFQNNIEVIPIFILSLLLGILVITGSSISLEGKTFWIIISNPIKPMTIFISKILANLVITGVIAIASYPLIISFIQVEYLWFYLIVPFIGSIISSTFGLILNLMFPKMQWDNEAVVVKQSLSAMLSLFLPPIILLVPYIIYFTELNKYYSIHQFMLMNILYLVLIELIFALWLNKKGKQYLLRTLNN